MTTRPSSPARQVAEELGTRLREIRTGAALTGRALAARAGWHYTKVSRMEHGVKTATEEEIRTWCRICGAEDQVPDLIATVRAIHSMYQELRRQTRAGMKRLMQAPVPLYERTHRFRIYEHNVIPGLFQTAGYARSMLTFWFDFLDAPNDLDVAVAARLDRQQVIHGPDKRFDVLLEEQALRTWFGSAAVQAEQLERLLTVMSHPHVSVRIIPMMIERPCVASAGFWIFDDELVTLETPTASMEITRPREIELYARMFEHLASVALAGRAARSLVLAVIKELRTD
ncbi:helix-turn-helix domain-containing protein [Nonomuraea basaltis]|uniref:helix-turn-helix domain-containing protein n=1 Tax=Nonomuraea basaltis TaxID=2495887 RepID=UPI00197CD778|nr:helix-turn-helix transcriptional regulator [Nonomuraea basaltis]